MQTIKKQEVVKKAFQGNTNLDQNSFLIVTQQRYQSERIQVKKIQTKFIDLELINFLFLCTGEGEEFMRQ